MSHTKKFQAAPARTLIDRKVIEHAFGKVPRGPVRCLTWMSHRYCGPTMEVKLTLAPCGSASVNAIVTQLPKGVTASAVLGRDLLKQVVEYIDPKTAAVTCRRRNPRR